MMELQNVLTEKGRLQAKVQRAIKSQATDYLVDLGFELKPNGKFAKVIATADGKDVTMNIDLAIGYGTDFSAKEKAPKAPTVSAPADIANLFE